jgi:2-(1,2-epoxy-1,2-dihydrophenyl)acetyl-CoA isomerase
MRSGSDPGATTTCSQFFEDATMTNSLLIKSREGAVMVVTLNRPESSNAIDQDMSQALLECAIESDGDSTIRSVLLRGNGSNFSAGGDVKGFWPDDPSHPCVTTDTVAHFHSAMTKLARTRKPLVVAVQGYAAGAGLSLAMVGDLVLAARSARFTLAYTGIGLSPDGGASWLLPRLVGLRRAQQMLLSNPRLTAQEAMDAGLVTSIVDDDALERTAMETALKLADGPTRAFGEIKELLLKSYGESFETHLEFEARSIAACGKTEDGREGIAAFLRKEKPIFKGR